ncbi:DUF4390 domain-containing protein [Ramlibacter sp. H39-3-26]|uniref:DUF4390 domain-containing protein n=1 Tax=Curvibacter soli TaxID=3031331 RepID=UPI0023D978F8|nr:DUF4390 domain-containing protein [Ramlibacter sp. H39-3-26]MDF1485915.1 DUF4390 domain-containing protein [Ramlibacter sp. H39-3-26]
MTDFSTRCLRSIWLDVPAWLAGLLLCLALGAPAPANAQASGAEIAQMRVERTEEGVFLTANMHFDLPALVEDALLKGIPMFFVAEADIVRERWYWYDQTLSSSARYMRLVYQPLTRRWRLTIAPTPITSNGLGVSLGQNFDDLSEALAALQRISRWKIAETTDIDAGGRQSVEFRFRLDVTQLPRPLQIGALARSDWSLALSRTLRLGAEVGQ